MQTVFNGTAARQVFHDDKCHRGSDPSSRLTPISEGHSPTVPFLLSCLLPQLIWDRLPFSFDGCRSSLSCCCRSSFLRCEWFRQPKHTQCFPWWRIEFRGEKKVLIRLVLFHLIKCEKIGSSNWSRPLVKNDCNECFNLGLSFSVSINKKSFFSGSDNLIDRIFL